MTLGKNCMDAKVAEIFTKVHQEVIAWGLDYLMLNNHFFTLLMTNLSINFRNKVIL